MVSSGNAILDLYSAYISTIPIVNVVLFFIGTMLLVKMIFKKQSMYTEGFEQEEKFILKENDELYDSFYCDVYNVLMNDEYKNMFELAKIIRSSKINKSSNVLDIGSGLGEHLRIMKVGAIPSIGIDNSKAMIAKCEELNPDVVVKYANAMDGMVFETNQFSHILCLFYTFYYMPGQEAFLRNCNKWLNRSGYVAIHIVDADKFHPIIKQSEVFVIPTQTFAKPGVRITESVVKFDGFDYNAKYIDKNRVEHDGEVEFEEIFTNRMTKQIRKNSHKMTILDISAYEEMFKRVGFEIHEIIDLKKARYFYQYVYILKKIN